MTLPLKNIIFDFIKENTSLTDAELSKILIKNGYVIAEDRFNKLLLDLEIQGLIKVAWLAKDTRRIEVIILKEDEDEVDVQNREALERDYEASFPGSEKV